MELVKSNRIIISGFKKGTVSYGRGSSNIPYHISINVNPILPLNEQVRNYVQIGCVGIESVLEGQCFMIFKIPANHDFFILCKNAEINKIVIEYDIEKNEANEGLV